VELKISAANTQFFLKNCLSYLVCRAWNQLKAAEAAGNGIEDLDAETRLFLENHHAYKLQRAWDITVLERISIVGCR
jgi:hypothetical protein